MINQRLKAACFRAGQFPDGSDWRNLLDAYVQAEARARKAEWNGSNHCITAEREPFTVRRTNYDDTDPRHHWTDEHWRAEVIGELNDR